MHQLSPLQFGQLLAAARLGDTDAREALVQDCYGRVEEIVHSALARDLRLNNPWINSRFSTGDVVQDVFRQLTRDLSSFRGANRDELISYLASSIHHRLLDAMRFHGADRRDGRRTAGIVEACGMEYNAEDPVECAVNAEEQELLEQAIEALPSKARELVLLRIRDQATFQEIARRLGYASMDQARRAYYSAEARLTMGLERHVEGGRR